MLKKQKLVKGMTMIETMITIGIIGIFVFAMIEAYRGINRGIFINRMKTVANNLAQERIESLKNYSYHRLITTTLAALSNPYDASNPYPPESITVTGKTFTRFTKIYKVKEDSGSIVNLAPTDTDMGLKRVVVDIEWSEAAITKSISLSNLHEDPNRKPLDATITGTITDTASVAVSSVHVYIIDNPNYESYTNASGVYSISIPAGTYTVRADKREYVSQTSGSLTVSSGTTTQNFTNYTLKPTGSASGYIFERQNLVISEVCAQYSGVDTTEYIEIYNPTSSSRTISSSNFKLKKVDSSNTITTIWSGSSITIPSLGYCLFASATPVGGVVADAVWTGGAIFDGTNQDRSGCLITDQNDVVIDKLSWGRPGIGQSAPSNGVEGTGIDLTGSGLTTGFCVERRPYPSVSPVGSTNGSARDSQDNSYDFVYHNTLNQQNTMNSETPTGGTEVFSAYVFADDGLSNAVATSGSSGAYSMSSVATGTWTFSASKTLYGEATGVVITASTNTSKDIVLTTTTTYGYITGQVTSGGSPLNGILVYSDGVSTTTDTGGNYRISISAGNHYVTANYNNNNATYTSSTTSSPVSVVAGSVSSGTNFALGTGGGVSGKITTNGIDALPNITIQAKDVTNVQRGTAVSDTLGNYTIKNLPVNGNTYTVEPLLDPKETSSPANRSVSVSAGATTTSQNFTITSGLGTINGSLTYSGKTITTGTLIIATTGTISGDPPTVNSSLRLGATIYYSTASDSSGYYEVKVRGSASGTTYNVYGWYTTSSGTTIKRSGSTTVTSGGTSTVNHAF